MAELTLGVAVNGQYDNAAIKLEIADLFHEAFEPLKTCDDLTMAYITKDKLICSQAVQRVIKLREDTAKILAENLTQLLLEQMKKHDTHNGYPKKESTL